MIISILDIAKNIGVKGTDLNSRDWGMNIRENIIKIIKNRSSKTSLILLDFSGVTSFNSSIADEVIVLLMRELAHNKNNIYYLVSQNIPDNSLYDLELVTAHRKIPCLIKIANKKAPVLICGKDASKMEKNQRLVFDIISRLGECTARKLADILEKDIYTASTYLNKLYKMRLFKRKELIDEKGKHFIYMPVI
jgi:hypothetical protein